MTTAPAFDDDFREQLSELIGWRRDVRHFRTDPLPEQDVEELLRLAQLAPSVGNSQPWRFVRVRSTGLRDAIARHVDDEACLAGRRYDDPERQSAYKALKLHGLREAPEAIAVFCDDETMLGAGLGAATMPEARQYSVVLAIGTLWLAARARGIALGWVSILDPDTVTKLLAVSPTWRLIALLCLGFPVKYDDRPELERRGWQARVNWTENVSVR